MSSTDDASEPPATRLESQFDVVELVATVLLGIAAIVIAWCTYQSALWGGQQDEGYTESVREANNAVDQLQAADSTRTLDQLLFVELVTSGVCTDGDALDPDACQLVTSNMSPAGGAAVDEWISGAVTSPFDSEAYVDALYGPGEASKSVSQEYFTKAGEANENGDKFELAATLLTIVMFFAGVSVVLHDRRIQWTLVSLAAALFAGSAIYVVSLPLA